MIDVKNLSKDYTIKRKGAGLSGALKGLFAKYTDVIHAVKDLPQRCRKEHNDQDDVRHPYPDKRMCTY